MGADNKYQECGGDRKITAGDINNILEVNKKAIEIQIEIHNQYIDVLEDLKMLQGQVNALTVKIDNIDKYLYKLAILLGSISVGAIVTIIKLFLNK